MTNNHAEKLEISWRKVQRFGEKCTRHHSDSARVVMTVSWTFFGADAYKTNR